MASVLGIVLLAAAALLATRSRVPAIPPPGTASPAAAGDPFVYRPDRQSEFIARAVAGTDHVLFTQSPDGAIATAARVARFRALIDRSTAGTAVDPDVLEGLVFVESAGRPQAIAGASPSAAAGLTQILPDTGTSLLGMHIDLARSRRLTAAIDAAVVRGQNALARGLERQRAAIDDRFDPRKALSATIAYLKRSEARFARADLAVVSYHMGIGNLERVLAAYDGGRSVPYAQLFFDTAPDRHRSAYVLLSGFGDESALYYWRVLGAIEIMRLYRRDRRALERLARLETAADSSAYVLHPPDRTPAFADPGALYRAYGARTIVPLPSNSRQFGIEVARPIGGLARRIGAPSRLYRGLRPAAIALLIELVARVRALSGAPAPLTLTSAVLDRRYEAQLDGSYPNAVTGYGFQLARRYAAPAQVAALQAMLDRLSALNLIAWQRTPIAIDITVAGDVERVIAQSP